MKYIYVVCEGLPVMMKTQLLIITAVSSGLSFNILTVSVFVVYPLDVQKVNYTNFLSGFILIITAKIADLAPHL